MLLKIKILGEEKPIASVFSSPEGTLRTESNDEEAKEYFSELINKIAKDNPTLPLVGGREEKAERKVVQKTTIKHIVSTDIQYLNALCDHLNKSKLEYKGRRFRAFVQESK